LTAPQEPAKEEIKVTPPLAVKPKAEPKALTPEEKWNALKPVLLRTFPVFQPGELDIVNCTVDDMRAHVEARLSRSKDQIRQIIPEY
jgi:hypothetical protein